jgi:hypothetical protein
MFLQSIVDNIVFNIVELPKYVPNTFGIECIDILSSIFKKKLEDVTNYELRILYQLNSYLISKLGNKLYSK